MPPLAVAPEAYKGKGFVRPGSEFIGQVRAFTTKIADADEQAYIATKAAVALAKDQHRDRPPPPRDLIAVQHAWTKVPLVGSLVRKINRDPGKLSIREVRLYSAYLRSDAWSPTAKETGLTMSLLRVNIDKTGVEFTVHELAFFGTHSLVRHKQRNFDVSEAALLGDMTKVFLDRNRVVTSGKLQFGITTREGRWLGECCGCTRHCGDKTNDGLVLRIQTYHADTY